MNTFLSAAVLVVALLVYGKLVRMEKTMATIEEKLRAIDTKNDANWDAATKALEDLAGDITEIKEMGAAERVSPELAAKMEATATKGDAFVTALKAKADEMPEITPDPDTEPDPQPV